MLPTFPAINHGVRSMNGEFQEDSTSLMNDSLSGLLRRSLLPDSKSMRTEIKCQQTKKPCFQSPSEAGFEVTAVLSHCHARL